MDYDIVLEEVGGFGKSQKLLGLIIGYVAVFTALIEMCPVFINYTADYRCKSALNESNYSENEIVNLTVPYEDERFDFCKRYKYIEECSSSNPEDCIDRNHTEACVDGYKFDGSMFMPTVVTEFELVCDRAALDGLATSLFMVGVLIGSVTFGIISDKFGRKKVMIGATLVAFTAQVGSAFTHSYVLFVATRVMVSTFLQGIYLASYVYLLEVCANKYRNILGMWFQGMFSFGVMALSGIAYNWRSWHEITFVLSLLCIPYPLIVYFIPESPRWLFSVGKNKEAKEVTRKLAKFNGNKIVEPLIWNKASNLKEDEVKESSIIDLFRTRRIRNMLFLSMALWFVTSAVYYGISYGAETLQGNIFVNNTLYGAVELISYVIIWMFMEKTGRKIMLVFMLLSCGLCLVATIFCAQFGYDNNHTKQAIIVFSMMAKCFIAGAYAIVYQFIAELFPTVVRSNAVGLASVVGNIGSVIAPLLLTFKDKIPWLPNTINCLIAVIGAFVTMKFPETTGVDMMATVKEAEYFYKHGKLPKQNQSKLLENIDNESEEGVTYNNILL